MKIEAHRILRQFYKYRNRRKALEKLDKGNFKIKESEQEKQRASLNIGTHTTLPCSCCACAAMSQKTVVLAVRRIDNRDSKAVFCARLGYPYTITCIYLNSLENIRAGARLISARS